MQAILLAGGLGTRLRSVVSDRPKPMALIEDRPFMDYVVRGLTRFGIDDIIFAVGYKGGMVEEYFGNGGKAGIKASYAYGSHKECGKVCDRGEFLCSERGYIL